MIDFESKIEIEELLAWMDGGSITLKCRNEQNQEFEIEFIQNVSWDVYESLNIPGRIYLNKKLVDQRSDLEAKIIDALRTSNLKSKNSLEQKILEEKLDYVNSEKYLTDQKKIKEEFTIGEFDFKIDSDNSTIEIDGNKIIDLTIKADENVFDSLCENDDFEFGYGLYPPEFYAYGIELGKKSQIVINEKNQYDYETALYFMEHNDLEINISIHNNWILVTGWTYINGKKYPITIKMKNEIL